MKTPNIKKFSVKSLLSVSAIFAVAACSSSNPNGASSTLSSTEASQIIGAVNNGVLGAGSGLGQTAAGGNSIAQLDKGISKYLFPRAYASGGGVSSVCNSNAQPLAGDGVTTINNSDANYPALIFFCALAQNTHDPDSVQGSYEMVKSVTCAATNAGVTFDGQAHNLTVTVDTNCFTAQQLTNMGNPGTMTITVTASQPAAFNTHYGAGIVLQIPILGTLSIGSNVSGSKTEFLVIEQDTAGGTTNKSSAYAGSFDSSTGELSFEARHDRLYVPGCASGSCGWSRHMRIHAVMSVDSAGNPDGLVSITGAYTSANSSPSFSVEADSISGDTTNGILARNWQSTNVGGASATSLESVIIGAGVGTDTYAETAYASNANCFGSNTIGLSTCGAGIAIPVSTTSPGAAFPFSQTGSGDGVSFTTPAAWGTALTSGLTFTNVTFADVQ